MDKEIKRCAIYTRKSSEDGLEQEYNSLDAQREKAEMYAEIQSEKGWTVLQKHYDDGGYSGGNTNRPALKDLLKDVENGDVDIILVYKTDRLSRWMPDFMDMIRLFDDHDVALVSVTESFDSKTPQGRLTLNVMQSFAQYEREVASERIRDKISASKAKGMWMGGTIPLGYDVKPEGGLIANAEEAETVNYIFRGYLKHGSIGPLMKELKVKGIQTKPRTTKKGKYYPPKNFSKSSLYRVLNNPIYIGKIQHKNKGKIYEGQHEAIISESLWNGVKALLDCNKPDQPKVSNNTDRPYLLKGIMQNPNGYSMTPSGQRKNGKIYRYYVSMEGIKKGSKKCPIKSVSAPLIEEVILDRVFQALSNPEWIARILGRDDNDVGAVDLRMVSNDIKKIWSELFPIEQARIVQTLIDKVIIHPDHLNVHFLPLGMVSLLNELKPELDFGEVPPSINDDLTLRIAISIKKRGARKYIKTPDGKDIVAVRKPKYDNTLIKAIVKAYDWGEQLDNNEVKTTYQIADREGVRVNYVQKILKLRDLAPDIVEAILNGRQPKSLTLSQIDKIPLVWQEQREQYGFAQAA